MNETTMPALAKTLRALSVLYVLIDLFLAAIPIAVPLFIISRGYIEGHPVSDFSYGRSLWPLYSSVFFDILIGAFLFMCYRFSRDDKRGLFSKALLWCIVLGAGMMWAIAASSLAIGLRIS